MNLMKLQQLSVIIIISIWVIFFFNFYTKFILLVFDKEENPYKLNEILTKNKFQDSLITHKNYVSKRSISDSNANIRYLNSDQNDKKIIIIADDNHIINNANKRIISSICKEKKLDYEIISCDDGMDILKFILDENIFDHINAHY